MNYMGSIETQIKYLGFRGVLSDEKAQAIRDAASPPRTEEDKRIPVSTS